jgi:predicted PurR-regulated permease PerM
MLTTNTTIIKKLLTFVLIVGILIIAKAFLIPLSFSGIVAMLFLPMCNWLMRKRVPKGLAVFICVVALVLIIATFATLVGFKIAEILNDVALVKEKLLASFVEMQLYIFKHLGISISQQSQILQQEQPAIATIVQAVFSSVSGLFANVSLVLIYFMFLLFYKGHIKQFVIMLVGESKQSATTELLQSITNVSQQYIVGLCKMIMCLWILYGIGFSVLGVKNAIFFAILYGVLEVVPYVGNLTGSLLTLIVAAIHGASATVLVGIAAVYGSIQLFQGWVLEPLMLGAQVKINALFTIIALVIGELLWGIAGIVLAIPLTAMFKIICDHITVLKPFAFLMGDTKVPPFKNKIQNCNVSIL